MTSNLPAVKRLLLLHITIYFNKELDGDAVKKTFDKAIDWIHYMPNCWMVVTSSDIERWHARLMPLLGDEDTMLICEIDPGTVNGWIENWVIEWFNKAKERVQKLPNPT